MGHYHASPQAGQQGGNQSARLTALADINPLANRINHLLLTSRRRRSPILRVHPLRVGRDLNDTAQLATSTVQGARRDAITHVSVPGGAQRRSDPTIAISRRVLLNRHRGTRIRPASRTTRSSNRSAFGFKRQFVPENVSASSAQARRSESANTGFSSNEASIALLDGTKR